MRMQCDFYERVVQTLRECNVISTNGVRIEWEAREQIILSMHSLVQFRGVKIRCARVFFLHSVYENGKDVK